MVSLLGFLVTLHPHWYRAYSMPQDPEKADLKILSQQGCTRCPRLGLDPTNTVLAAGLHIIVEDVGLGPGMDPNQGSGLPAPRWASGALALLPCGPAPPPGRGQRVHL